VVKAEIKEPCLYLNRELSWLAFNHRVLSEAASADWPLLERLKFFAIYFSNLDEFFMIRVSALHEQNAALGAALTENRSGTGTYLSALQDQNATSGIDKSPDGLTPGEQLSRIGAEVRNQLQEAAVLLSGTLLSALQANGIHIHRWEPLSKESRELAHAYFRETVFPILTPLVVDPVHPFPFLSNLSLSLAVEVRDPATQVSRFARVKVPEILPRFISIEGLAKSSTTNPDGVSREQNFLPLEELIQANLLDLFPGMEIVDCHLFRITRDMDIDILEEEARDLLSVISQELRRRKFGEVVRLELGPGVPEKVRRLLIGKLQIAEGDVYEYPGLLGASAFFALSQLPRPDLRDSAFTPTMPPSFGKGTDIFSVISEADRLIHMPYQAFT